MARITYGSLITDIRGSIGGITFQRNASGAIARLKPNATVNPSQLLSNRQTALGSIVALWATLTTAQQHGWSQLAIAHPFIDPWGVAKQLNGYQQFLSNNLNLESIGVAALLNAPAYLLPEPPPTFSVSFGSMVMSLNFESPVNPSTYSLITYSTPLLRSTVASTRKAKYIIPLGSWLSSTKLNITSSFCNYFNIIYADLLEESQANLVIRTRFIDPVSGFASVYTSAIARVETVSGQFTLTFSSNADLLEQYPDAANVAFWNTQFDLPTNGNPFTSVVVNDTEITLIGGSNITIVDHTLTNSAALLSLIDQDGCIVAVAEEGCSEMECREIWLNGCLSVGSVGFGYSENLFALRLNACTELAPNAITSCYGLTLLELNSLFVVPSYSISDNYALGSLSLPEVTTIEDNGFGGMDALTSISLPICTSVGASGMSGLTAILEVHLPECLAVGNGAFENCTNCTIFDMPKLSSLGTTVNDDGVWSYLSGLDVTLTIPSALMICLNEGPDGDILFLQANNNVTIIET